MDQQLGNNQELNDALTEFETKFNPDQTPSGEQQIDQTVSYSSMPTNETPKIVQKVIKYSGGMIKNETQANYVLIFLVVVMFSLAAFFFIKGSI